MGEGIMFQHVLDIDRDTHLMFHIFYYPIKSVLRYF